MATLRTPLCDKLGIEHPIIQAPIGSASTPALAAAVSNAGALGMLSVTWRSLDEVRRAVRETRERTSRPFGVNLVLEWPAEERLRLCLNEGVRIFSFFWGDPGPLGRDVHAAGGLVLHTVGDAREARQAVAAGADVIVAQGWEAGGHVRGQVATMALVPRVVDAVAPTPVVAAGGIADGRGLAAALALGAAGVWMGTLFLPSEEAAAHPWYKQSVVRAAETDTVYSSLFDGGWPNAPHRVLRNSTVAAWEAAGSPPTGKRPGEGEIVARFPDAPIARYSDVPPLPGMTGNVEALPHYAGQGVGLVTQVKPAREIIRDLIEEAQAVLARFSP